MLVALFFALTYMLIGGTYINIDPNDELLWLKTTVHFCFIVFTMMLLPFCYKKFGKNVTIEKGGKLCVWNALIVLSFYFFIDAIMMGGIYDETIQNLGGNIVYAVMFVYINAKFFFSNSKKEKHDNSNIPPNTVTQTPYSLSPENQTEPQEKNRHEIYSSDIALHPRKEVDISNEAKLEGGFVINVEALNDTDNNMPSSKKQVKRTSPLGLTIILTIITILSLAFNFSLFKETVSLKNNIQELEGNVSELNKENNDYYNRWLDKTTETRFYNEYVALVEDNGTNLYHKYGCSRFKGNYFLVYSVPEAQRRGYKSCLACH